MQAIDFHLRCSDKTHHKLPGAGFTNELSPLCFDLKLFTLLASMSDKLEVILNSFKTKQEFQFQLLRTLCDIYSTDNME